MSAAEPAKPRDPLTAAPAATRVVSGSTASTPSASTPAVSSAAASTREAFAQALHESSPDGFMLLRAVRESGGPIVDFEWRYVNPAAGRLVGRAPDSLVGRRLLQEMPGNRVDGLFDAYVEVVTTGVTWQREFSYQHEGVDATFRTIALRVEDGFAVTFSDVSGPVRADSTLRATAARLRLLADAGRALGSVIERDAACAIIAELLVPRVADACTVDLTDPDGRPRRVTSVTTDPVLAEALPLVRPETLSGSVLARPATPPLSVTVAVPILERGQPTGVLRVATGAIGRWRTDDDDETVALFEELARRLAVTLERIQLLTDAQTARHEAEEANRAKSQFLATMSHELRTPLNAILGYADLLDAGIGGPLADGQLRYVDRMRASGRHLLGLIDDVLDFAKLEAGTLAVAREPAALVDAFTAAEALVRPQSRARGVTFRVSQPPRAVRYLGDEDRVRQVLINLLSNAIKFTPPSGEVSLSWDVTGAMSTDTDSDPAHTDAEQTLVPPVPARPGPAHGWLRVTVRDSGIGIPHEALDRVFEPFVQVDASRTRTAEGTGLGLAISRQFASRMQGDLTVASEPGAGSVFALWLPLTRPDVVSSAPRVRTRIELGRFVLSHVGEIVARIVTRLRQHPLVPNGATAAQTDLENHLGTFLADFAQQFTILDDGGVDVVPLVRDGSELQRLLVDKHGRQRRRLGWPEAALAMEFEVVADEIAHVVREDGTLIGSELDDVLALMTALLDEAVRVSLVGYHAAAPSTPARGGTAPARSGGPE